MSEPAAITKLLAMIDGAPIEAWEILSAFNSRERLACALADDICHGTRAAAEISSVGKTRQVSLAMFDHLLSVALGKAELNPSNTHLLNGHKEEAFLKAAISYSSRGEALLEVPAYLYRGKSEEPPLGKLAQNDFWTSFEQHVLALDNFNPDIQTHVLEGISWKHQDKSILNRWNTHAQLRPYLTT